MKTALAAGAATLMLLTAACTGGPAPAPTTRTTTVWPAPTTEVATLPASLVRFGDYTVIPLADPDTPAYAGPATPQSLSGVLVADTVQRALDQPGVTATLTDQGFVVQRFVRVSTDYWPPPLLHFLYQGNNYQGWPVFVTTDAAYHVWHLGFDKVLRTLETEVLLPELEQLVSQTLEAAHDQTTELAGSPLADAAARAEQLYQVAAAELGQGLTLGTLARQEKALVDQHNTTTKSPITGAVTDYSVFTPRGHYTRSEALSRYFVAMSVLGQASFPLPADQASDLDATRIAVLASRALVADPARVSLWKDLYEPTAFLVGYADDYTPLELAAAAGAATSAGLDDPTAFARDDVVRQVVAALTSTRPILINPEDAGVRLMGTRFVLDSFMMDQLIWPNVGTQENKRLLPSALDVAAALGSQAAHDALEDTGATEYANYETQLATLTQQVADRPGADWGGTVYDAWLYALQPVFARHGTAYPDFMRSPAWAAEDLQSGLGSYAQLKHDTILYTKQAMAEGGDREPVPPRNWVEPDPVAFLRLQAAVDLMRGGLTARNLATAEQKELLTDIGELFGFLARIASDELAGKPISEDDNSRLKWIGEELEALWVRTSDQSPEQYAPITDLDSAIIADIASGPDGVLEIGTGRFDRLFVLVPDDAGRFQVAAGAVFSFYEFTVPPGQRLTDETWRARLDSGQAPPRPDWQDVLFPR
jgi:hypothetical protein